MARKFMDKAIGSDGAGHANDERVICMLYVGWISMNYSSYWILLLVVGYNLRGFGLGGHNLSQSDSWDYSLNVCCARYFSDRKSGWRHAYAKRIFGLNQVVILLFITTSFKQMCACSRLLFETRMLFTNVPRCKKCYFLSDPIIGYPCHLLTH